MRSNASITNIGSGFWYNQSLIIPGCTGKIITSASIAAPDTLLSIVKNCWPAIINKEIKKLKKSFYDFKAIDIHFKYYMNTHTVIDEGYNQVAYRQNDINERHKEAVTLIRRLKAIAKNKRHEAFFLSNYAYCAVDSKGNLTNKYKSCHRIKIYLSGAHGMVVIQSDSHLRPASTVYLNRPLVNPMNIILNNEYKNCTMYAFNYSMMPDSITQAKVSRFKGHVWKTSKGIYGSDIPIVNCAEGAPVVNNCGVLIGVADKGTIIPIRR